MKFIKRIIWYILATYFFVIIKIAKFSNKAYTKIYTDMDIIDTFDKWPFLIVVCMITFPYIIYTKTKEFIYSNMAKVKQSYNKIPILIKEYIEKIKRK